MSFAVVNLLLAVLPAGKMEPMKKFFLSFFDVHVGKNTKIAQGVKFFGRGSVFIGDNCWIGHECRFYVCQNGPIFVGNNCDIAPEVVFHSGTHEVGDKYRRAGNGAGYPVRIGDGCWVGCRTTFVAGASVGDGSVVAAGSLVIGSHQDNIIVAGVPAKRKKNL